MTPEGMAAVLTHQAGDRYVVVGTTRACRVYVSTLSPREADTVTGKCLRFYRVRNDMYYLIRKDYSC